MNTKKKRKERRMEWPDEQAREDKKGEEYCQIFIRLSYIRVRLCVTLYITCTE